MERKIYYSSFLVIAIISILSLSFSTSSSLSEKEVLETIQQDYSQNLDALTNVIRAYHIAAKQLSSDPTTQKELQQRHLATRQAFKKVEYLLEYFDYESVKFYLNGAPLLSLEPNVPETNILEPVGLQVLDEMIFEDELIKTKKDFEYLTEELALQFNKISAHQKNIQLQHRYIFEAARLELIRIFTLGVTGFDTPGGSTNAIPEAKTALETLSKTINLYCNLLEDQSNPLVDQLQAIFYYGIDYLNRNQDFETFNRLKFLKKVINPLYEKTLHLQKTIGIETIEEVSKLPHPINYESENIFANDFLNPNYYANVSTEELSTKRIQLGKVLFFDPILSVNNQRACASCHDPTKGFTDGLDKSLALNAKKTISRNSPTLINSVFADKYFYDLRETDLERQIKHVVLDSLEFGTDFFEIVDKINQSTEYQDLFNDAYPDNEKYQVSKWSVSNALACYVASLHSFNSDFDKYVRDETASIDESVERGFNLFMGKAACGTCHFAPTFNGSVPPLFKESESEVLGVPFSNDTINPKLDYDRGRVANSRPRDEAWFYSNAFKTVTVRNIQMTAPYMHNGVYHGLEEVIDFYNKGGGIGLGLDVPNQTLPDAPLDLTQGEISDLVAFMESLTDLGPFAGQAQDIRLPAFDNKPDWNTRKMGGEY